MARGGQPIWLRRVGWFIGSGFATGLAPVGPGTAGSAAALLIYYFLPIPGDSPFFFLLIGAGLVVGIWATGVMATERDPDPGSAVWDEFVGMWVTCFLLPKEWVWLVPAFFLFRVLDVVKPWPARRLESLPGGWGIMADDLMVGIYGAVGLNVVRLAFFA